MEHWKDLKRLILSEKYSSVHKTVWEDHAVITDRCGNRFKIHDHCPIEEARALMNEARDHETVMLVLQSTANISILSALFLIFNLN